jgi:hypothetical protein
MSLEEIQKQGREYSERYREESDEDFVNVVEKGAQRKKSLNRQIEEGVFNLRASYPQPIVLNEGVFIGQGGRSSV